MSVDRAGLKVAPALVAFLEERVLPTLPFAPNRFWEGLAQIYVKFAPRNAALLQRRRELQEAIDLWHEGKRGVARVQTDYENFLRGLGYIEPEAPAFQIQNGDVDVELRMAGPQLVVPATNRRFALNAVNARWGSLYDVLRTSDVLAKGESEARDRTQAIRDYGRAFLDKAVPLKRGSWATFSGDFDDLAHPAQYLGACGLAHVFENNGLKLEIVVDRESSMGRDDAAGIGDIRLESALSAIVDFEDSVATVDAEDKTAAYETWLGLMRGDLTEHPDGLGPGAVSKKIAPDDFILTPEGERKPLRRRALLLVRVVGEHMTTSAIRLGDDAEAPEGVLDTVIAALIGSIDFWPLSVQRNSLKNAIYIVKPKLHGSLEAAYTNDLFDAVEDLLTLPRHTLKIGLMDEERRTSVNLSQCINALRERIVFVNTGFLDRTGDEIHTSMRAGAVASKAEMKVSTWYKAYEDRNVRIALAHGFAGRAQIGKGMWAMPDRMADMVAEKGAHPTAGANTAWVPSPTAATLHALHYHDVDVAARQRDIAHEQIPGVGGLLDIPLAKAPTTPEALRRQVDDTVQSVLGYVVRWVDAGVGCSKVPNLDDIGLMEDRATLRISCQMIANWLMHGVVDASEVDRALAEMAAKVDAQNRGDPNYRPMTGGTAPTLALKAARALLFEGASQSNGYTEPLLIAFRRRAKANEHAHAKQGDGA